MHNCNVYQFLTQFTEGITAVGTAMFSRLMGGASSLAQPPRIIGVFPQSGPHHFRTVAMPPSLGVYLAGVADPGNVGTLVRTSAALGADWLALGWQLLPANELPS
jgi:hypothetical protein